MSDQTTQKVTLPDEKKKEEKPASAVKTEDKKEKKADAPERQPNSTPKKANIFGIIAGAVALVLILVFVFVSLWSRMNSKDASTPSISQTEEIAKLREELRKEREKEFNTPTPTPAPVAEKEFRRVDPGPMRNGEPKAPPVVQWIRHGNYLIPARQMSDGVAGYGETYSRPPSGGALPPEAWAKPIARDQSSPRWTRNERGDWAISVQ